MIRRLGARMPVSTVVDGPLVSVVVVGRDRGPIPAALRRAIEHTTYRPIEILLSDATPETRASAIGSAVAGARGEIVCLLDPAAEPARADWLGHLVESLLGGAVGVGPLIVRAAGRRPVPASQTEPDLTLLSSGIDLAREGADALPRHIGIGADPLTSAGRVVAVPGLATACLVVRRADLVAAGIPSGYEYDGIASGPAATPYLDMDLSIRLRSVGGSMLVDGRTAIRYHVERGPLPPLPVRPARRSDPIPDPERDVFLDAWGPRLWREAMLDVVDDRHLWSSRPLAVAIVGPAGVRPILPDGPPPGLDWQLARWSAGLPEPDDPAWSATDVAIVVDPGPELAGAPPGPIRIAWLDPPGSPADDRRLQAFDIVLAGDADTAARVQATVGTGVTVADLRGPAAAEQVERALVGWLRTRRVGIRIGVTRPEATERWGDTHFARAVQRELERSGYPTRIHILPSWAAPVAAREDATLHVFGLRAAPTRPSQVNLLWQISHPDLADPDLYDHYDAAFVASDRFAASMAARTTTAVRALHQATDPDLMRPDPSGPHHELLFVANSRNIRRTIVDDLADTSHDLAIYGQKWTPELVDPRFVRGDGVPADELARYYSSADIVLNDHWQDMRTEGFISNRIYDALAAEAFVISDHLDEIAPEFDGAVPTFADRAGLEALIDRYLADPPERRRLAERGRRIVLERHTFRQRVDVIVATLRPLLAERPSRIVEDGP